MCARPIGLRGANVRTRVPVIPSGYRWTLAIGPGLLSLTVVRLRHHLQLAAGTGALIGLIEGVALARPGGVVTASAAAVLGMIAGVLVGCVQWLIDRLSAPLRRAAGVALALDASDRAAVVRRHALALAGVVLAPGFVVALIALVRKLDTVQESAIVAAYVATFSALGLVGLALGVVVLGGLLMRPVAALDRRVSLPRPRRPALRLLVYCAAPAAIAAASALAALHGRLGPLAAGPWLVLALALELGVGLIAAAVAARMLDTTRVRLRRVLPPSVAIVAIVTLAAAERDASVHAALDRTHAPALARALLRELADVDRDGYASLFGEGDCAGADPRISPLGLDTPDNGVDENCDGRDATVAVHADLERYSGGLAEDRVRRYNVLLIVVDALRADHTSLHDPALATTPYLQRFAGESLVFDQALTQSSATMLSIPSLQSGRYPGAIEWHRDHGRLQLGDDTPTLAERLARAGYRTGLIGSDYFPKKLPGILRGHHVFRDVSATLRVKASQRRTESIVTAYALEFLAPYLAGKAAPPFFLTLYFSDPHEPYIAHAPGYPDFGNDEQGRYDQEIAAIDRYIGVLLDLLQWTPLWDDTVVIITSDHGEEFGDHGGRRHATTCHIESVHVPLLLRVPGIEGARYGHPVALVDVVPTVLELTGLDLDAPLPGQSLLTAKLAPERVRPERPVFCSIVTQKASQGGFQRHAVRSGALALLYDVFTATYTLFDRESDPQEQRPIDLADPRYAARAEELKAALNAHLTGNLAGQ